MKIDLLGVKIDNLTKQQIMENIETRLKSDRSIFIVTPYSESIVVAQKDQEFRKILNSADFALPDGMGILWVAKFLGLPTIPEKISGSEFVWDLAELAAKKNLSIFLLGGFGDTPALAAVKLQQRFPNLKVAGTFNESNLSFPRRRESSSIKINNELDSGSVAGMTEKAIEAINNSNADFLFVALGPAKQEKWIYQNLPNLRTKLAIGLGGTFDHLAGKRVPAPRFMARVGLEWLWRLITQPWRIFRIFRGVLGLIYYSLQAKL